MAQIQYNLAIEHLKPINDNLWIAGALEGLCAVAMCQHSCDQFSNLNIIHPKFLHHRDLEKLLASNQLKKSYSQESDMSEHSTASSLDLASSKSQQPLIISSTDCCNYALETIELYNKVELNPYLFEEFKFKVVRLFISESQKRKACEILDSLVEPSLKSFSIESACSMKRYLTIARLYKSMNFNRKASLALWLLFTANPSNYLDFEHEILLNGLKIQSPYSSDFAHTSETKLPDTNDDTIMNTSTFNNNFTNTDNKELTCVLHGNQPPVNIIHRLVSCPPLWSPFIVLNHLHWLTHITTNSSMLSTNALSYIIKLKSVHNMTRQMNNLSTNSNLSSLYSLKSCLPFRSVGWYELQLKVMLHLINECKRKINLEDIAEISWDIGLKLIGYCFSVLDSWPDYIQKTSCISCMDDLCRLAVLRCPDLPTNLPSMTLVNYSADGKISVHSRRWPRNRRVIYSHGLCYLMYRDNDEAQMKVTEKQMLDLVEIPVHQLPLVRLIDIPSLPSHLLPHTLSKNAAENVVSLSKGRTVVIRPDRNQAKQFEVSSAESSKSAGLFVYNPFQTDNSSGNKYPVIDWICEEPAYIELIVDNKLPIDLRISDLHVELMPINTVMNSSNRVSSSTSDYESLFGGGCITNGCSGVSNLIRLEAVCLIVETSQSVKILPTTHLSNHYFENMRHHTNKNGFSGCLENSCLLEEADLHRQFPNTNTECFWRKTILDVNCKLPSHTSRIKLSIGVVPTVDMLISNSSSEDSNIYVHYRVVGITYRLVDCGGMRVYLRPPRKLIYSLATFGELSNRGGGREKHSSGSSSSTLSTVRSSWNVGSEPIGSSNGISGSSEFDSEHILSNALGIQFLLLPLIRLQPPMPRMCIFPGRICSAFDLHEAMDILEKESSAKYPCTLSEQLHSLGLSKFHVPDPSTWSNRVAAVLDLTIFPYETRWLPIELYIRDENRLNVSTNNNNSDSNFDFDSNCSVKRYLNVLHVNLKSVSTSLSFLTKLNLTATDFVQCVGLENLHKKFPLLVENNEIPNSLPNISSDYDERSLPLYATHVGVIWLKFDSDKYWQIVTSRFSSDPDLNELMKTVQVQSIYIQLEMEYALDAIKHTPSSSEHNSSSLLPNQSLARQISLGFKLKLLSSNLAPLKLSDLMLTFEDETPINEYYLHNKRMAAKSVGEKIHAQSFLYGSIETNLSDMFLPEISIKPEQLLDYRLEIELNEGWSNEERQSNSIQLTSPWLTHVFPNRSDSISKRKQSVSSSELLKTPSGMTSNSSSSPVLNSNIEDTLNPLETTHQIRLELNGFSDLVISNKLTKFVNLEQLKSNELGIPIPVKSEVPGTVLESNIKIFWNSRLQARWISDCKSHIPQSTGDLREEYEIINLCSYFRRYGRIILSSHEYQIDPKWFVNKTTVAPLSKPWYEYPFLNPGSAAGLLWANNIWIDISLDPPIFDFQSTFLSNLQMKKLDPQSQLCLQCRQDYSLAVRRTTVCTQRRISTISLLLNQEIKLPNGLNASRVQTDNCLKVDSSLETRKISMPDLTVTQKSTMLIDKDDLYSSSRICTYPLNPVSVTIHCGIRHNFLKNVRINTELKANTEDSTIQQNNSLQNSSDVVDSVQEFQVEHVWMGPAVYRHVQHISNDNCESTQTTLLGPLIEGRDYVFVGKASGSVGISVPQSLTSSSSSSSNQKPETSVSSIIFLRPGKFWVCGLLGVLPNSSVLTMTNDGQIPASFNLPSVHSVETIRFSPNGVYIHVLDSHI
ncbi:Trafficking protein particle complex subunit 9 [Schistosoma japonicum]|uniref:Trafficking protein particle complex subunit 9 n=2 Tax=Schistosoma japonicum TaxID=6182 RepID=A0A4Z2D602_SCHJA|nr:Trafficking protein particle complex subunit 9 [Schistosoma japonicum]